MALRLKRRCDKKDASQEIDQTRENCQPSQVSQEGEGKSADAEHPHDEEIRTDDQGDEMELGEDATESQETDIQCKLAATQAELKAAQDELAALSAELVRVSNEKDTWAEKAARIYDEYKRVHDDMEGFRKRVERDFDDRLTRAMAGFMKSLLEVMDNFDRSIETMESQAAHSEADLTPFLKGVTMIRDQMLGALSKGGVEPIPSPVGLLMDPTLHEAVEAQEGGGEHGTVLAELQKGYKFKNLVLRATKVRVIR